MGDGTETTGFTVGEAPLTCARLVTAARHATSFSLAPAVQERIREARKAVDRIAAGDAPVYGINTGVGSQKEHKVGADEAAAYNRRLIRGHGTRVPGPTAEPDVVRATIIVLLHELASGSSGASLELVELMAEMASAHEMPSIDTSGSIGASDLVPLSQIADWALSHPKAVEQGLPFPKDALAMINCNALSLASGALCITELSELMRGFDLAAAMTMEGFRCNLDAISEPVNSVHRRQGQAKSAARMREALADSVLWQPGAARFLQDPLSFRNASQVNGAGLECASWLEQVWDDELAGTVINPLVNIGPNAAYSHGNMDTTRMTLALDGMRQALAKMADLAGERVHKQQWPAFSGLPIGLAEADSAVGGVQFLNLGHITASLITSVKIWAQPHLLHPSGQVADGVEDTASNAVHAVHELARQIDACWKIIGLEIAVACWAVHRRRIPAADLGTGLRTLYENCVATLPIGHEGEEVFRLAETIAVVRDFISEAALPETPVTQ